MYHIEMDRERKMCRACEDMANGIRYIYCVEKESLMIRTFYLNEIDTRDFHDEDGFVIKVVKVKYNDEDYNNAVRNTYTKDTGRSVKDSSRLFSAWRIKHDV